MFYAQSTSTVLLGWCLTKLHLFLLGLEDHVCLLFRLTKERGYRLLCALFQQSFIFTTTQGTGQYKSVPFSILCVIPSWVHVVWTVQVYHFPYLVSSPFECTLYGQYKSTIFHTSCHPQLSACCTSSPTLQAWEFSFSENLCVHVYSVWFEQTLSHI